MIPDDKIAEVRERTDIVALIGEYVPLKRAGGSFKGLCPFHSEKTPSFHVHPARQFFHCFGCQASGDVFSFMMRIDGRPFPEVARSLAERAGIELPAGDPEEEAEYRRVRQRAERLVGLMDAAAGFYMQQLSSHPHAALARAELERRGIGAAMVERFRLGYAPHAWDALTKFLHAEGWSTAEAEELGLVVPRRSGGGHYDRFRHRLLFPITDLHGRIVAFSGRALPLPAGETDRDESPKYVNSPEGPLYRKGEILFGLHEGRVEARREGWLLVCEGNFDLVALHQADFANSVAPMGTALTEAHARLLRRFVERVVLLFDGDRAGKKAVAAAFPLLQRAGISARVVSLPEGEDPDSVLRKEGTDALRARIDSAPGMVEFLIDQAAADTLGDARATAEAIASLGPVLLSVDNPVEAQLYVERVARRFSVSDVQAVRRQLRKGVGPAGAGRSSRPRSRGGPGQAQRVSLPALECELVGAILDNTELLESEECKKLSELLTSSEIRAIFHATSRMVGERGSVDGPSLLAELVDNPASGWLKERLAIQKYDERGAIQALRDGIPRLARQNIERELPRLGELILEARRQGDDARAEALTYERNALYQSSNRWVRGQQ